MPQMTYQDREGGAKPVPAGHYIVGVEAAKLGIAKSSGNEQIALEARILYPTEGPICYAYLGFAEKQQWVIDVFLKSIQRNPAKGVVLDITDDWLQKNVVGALGWVEIGLEEQEYPAGSGKKQRRNQIDRWITTRDAKHADPYTVFSETAPKDDGSSEF